jgi:hypothetical protein
MNWINIKDQQPKLFQEVIICSNFGNVKSAIYMGNGKWNTFVEVAYWQPFPNPPETLNETKEAPVDPIKKKRGRPKKS